MTKKIKGIVLRLIVECQKWAQGFAANAKSCENKLKILTAMTTEIGGLQMKLFIRRGQQDMKGLLGGHKGVKFKLEYRIETSPEEQALIEKYKVGNFLIHEWPNKKRPELPFHIFVVNMIVGGAVEIDDFHQILEAEEEITKGAFIVKKLLDSMKKFGGEETIEI